MAKVTLYFSKNARLHYTTHGIIKIYINKPYRSLIILNYERELRYEVLRQI